MHHTHVRSIAPHPTGLLSLGLQLTCVITAVVSVTGSSGTHPLMVAITASRLGLWGFDLSERQIVQEDAVKTLPATEKTMLFNWEKALCNAAYLVMVGLSLIYDSPADFGVLIVVSAAAIAAAFGMALVAVNSTGTSTGNGTGNRDA